MIERLLGDEPEAPPPAQPHHLDIDLEALTSILQARPSQYVRTIQGLTGEEKLTGAVIEGPRIRLFFDRAVVQPTFMAFEVPRADP